MKCATDSESILPTPPGKSTVFFLRGVGKNFWSSNIKYFFWSQNSKCFETPGGGGRGRKGKEAMDSLNHIIHNLKMAF